MTPPRLDPLSVQAKIALLTELVEDVDAVGSARQVSSWLLREL